MNETPDPLEAELLAFHPPEVSAELRRRIAGRLAGSTAQREPPALEDRPRRRACRRMPRGTLPRVGRRPECRQPASRRRAPDRTTRSDRGRAPLPPCLSAGAGPIARRPGCLARQARGPRLRTRPSACAHPRVQPARSGSTSILRRTLMRSGNLAALSMALVLALRGPLPPRRRHQRRTSGTTPRPTRPCSTGKPSP